MDTAVINVTAKTKTQMGNKNIIAHTAEIHIADIIILCFTPLQILLSYFLYN